MLVFIHRNNPAGQNLALMIACTAKNCLYVRDHFHHSKRLREIIIRTGIQTKFHIPSAIADLKLKRGEKKLRVTVTCIAQPPVDRTKGSEYSAANISASIHRLNSNGNIVVDNPSVSDNRNKWDTCYHFSNEFSSFDSGSWEVWLELFTRWGICRSII